MSVNLHLSLKISGYDASHQKEIENAVQEIFEQEEIDGDMSALAESGEGENRVLESHSDQEFPLIISGAHRWLPEIQKNLAQAVTEANGKPCHVEFEGLDADEGLDEDEEEEDS